MMEVQTKTVSTGDYAWRSWSNGYVISLALTEDAADAGSNTSLVSYRFTISNTDNNRFLAGGFSWDIFIGGKTISIRNFDFNLGSNYTTQEIAAGQISVVHDADGKLDMPYSVSIPDVKTQNSYGPPAMTLSGNWKLTDLPRLVEASCPLATIGSTVEITVRRTDASFYHTLIYQFGMLSGMIVEKSQQDKVSWTVPEDLYTQIPNAKTGNGEMLCVTYQGSRVIGTTSCVLAVEINQENAQPTLSASVVDINEDTVFLTGNANHLIRYCSTAKAESFCHGNCGAEITDYQVRNNGIAYTADPTVIHQVESGDFLFSATDTRNFTRQVQITKEVIPYVKLSCNLRNNKPDGAGGMQVFVSGNYFSGSFGVRDNTLAVQYRYKKSSDPWQNTEEEWHTLPYTLWDNTYTAEATLTGLDYQTAYTFQARAIDRLATVVSVFYTTRATPVFDWGENDFHIHGELRIQNRPVKDFVIAQGTEGVWQYRRWTSGYAECRCFVGEDNPQWKEWSVLYQAKLQVALPFAFERAPWVLATPGTAEGNIIAATHACTDSIEIWVCSPFATGGAFVNVYVAGMADGKDGAILGTAELGNMTLGKGSV